MQEKQFFQVNILVSERLLVGQFCVSIHKVWYACQLEFKCTQHSAFAPTGYYKVGCAKFG